MEREDMLQHKQRMETQILQIVNDFEDATGLTVSNINVTTQISFGESHVRTAIVDTGVKLMG